MLRKKRVRLLLLPSLAGIAVFYGAPFLVMLYYAFTENAITGKFVGFSNFVELFQNPYFRLAAAGTGRFVCLGVTLTLLVSIVLAMLTAHFAARIPFVKSAFFLPYFLPSATAAALWTAYFADLPPFSSLLLLYLWKYGGLHYMLILSAICAIPREVLEAAQMDGASAFRRTVSVVLPNCVPTLFFTGMLAIVNALKIFRESYLLYGNYPEEEVYMLQNFLNNHFNKLNYQTISSAAILFFVILYTVVYSIFSLEKKWSAEIW